MIIPQLGAFVARRVEGRFSPDENLFLPPYRTVHFNPQIRRNDGLLENSLIEQYNVSLQEAKQMCSEFVDHINMKLVENGTMDFGTIGVFSQDELGIITFMPCLAGVTTPALYGLDAFQMPKLRVVPCEKKKVRTAVDEKDSQHITIQLNKVVIKYIAAVAASVVLFLCLSTPTANTSLIEEQDAATRELFMPRNLWPESQAKPLVDIVESSDKEGVLSIETVSVETSETSSKEIKSEEPQPIEGDYAIVFASAISLRNAKNYANILQNRGINAIVQNKANITRVVLPGFLSSDEARSRMSELKAMDKEFESIWILNLSKQ